MREGASIVRRLTDIDWANWSPDDVATLTFVVRDGRILLIRKKRGLGAGKLNGPGGKLEPGETILDCAIREVEEEVGVTPHAPRHVGELRFQFTDGYGIHVHVFRSDDCAGSVCETDEAIPLWTDVAAIPYAEMWADDELWIPMLLAGKRFVGRFVFDADAMLDHELGPAAEA
jgi:8-oxo-dGTP diphosphatase